MKLSKRSNRRYPKARRTQRRKKMKSKKRNMRKMRNKTRGGGVSWANNSGSTLAQVHTYDPKESPSHESQYDNPKGIIYNPKYMPPIVDGSIRMRVKPEEFQVSGQSCLRDGKPVKCRIFKLRADTAPDASDWIDRLLSKHDDALMKEGFLQKQGNDFLKRWKRRKFVFDPEADTLSYY